MRPSTASSSQKDQVYKAKPAQNQSSIESVSNQMSLNESISASSEKGIVDRQNVAISQEKKFEQARNWTLTSSRELLTVTNYVDAKDQVNNWCVGQITEEFVDNGTVKVHFEGWSDRHDVILKKNSNKIAPFRQHTCGYTGQKRSAYRDFKLNQAQQIIIEKKVRVILDTKFSCFNSAHECTQFIRGELYFYLDSLLTLQQSVEPSDLPGIVEFVRLCFELLLTWMEVFNQYQDAYIECQQSPLLFCVDLPAAISQCCYELVELLGKTWGQCSRARTYFTHFKSQYIKDGPFARRDKIGENGLVMSLTNVFGEINGFERVIKVIKGNDQCVFPLSLTGIVLNQLCNLSFFFEVNQMNRFASEVSQTIMHRLDNLTDQEIKEIDRSQTRRVLAALETFIKIYQPQTNVFEVSETYELRIAQKYLMSPFFDKKIRGMAEFKDIFNKVENRQRYTENEIRRDDTPVCRFLNFQNFSNWISQTQVLEYIYIENPHGELIKRSLELTYLRAIDKENPLQDHLIDAIWRCATEKHEDIMRTTLSTIEHLIQFLQLNQLEKFYAHLKLLPESSYNEMYVEFLKKYTEGALEALFKHRNVLKQSSNARGQTQQSTSTLKNFFGGKNKNTTKDPSAQIDASKYLDLNKFWQISQDSNTSIPQSCRTRALACLIEILEKNQHERSFTNQMSKIDFMNLALENIQNKQSIYTSINFIKSLIITYPKESSRNYSNMNGTGGRTNNSQSSNDVQVETRERIVQQLLDQDIFTKLIDNATWYQRKAVQMIQSTSAATIKEAGGAQNLKLFGDNNTHREYIDCFMSFIEFLISSSKNGNLSFANIQLLFKTMVMQSISDYEQKVFFNFLTKENDAAVSRERKFLLDERRRTDVFQKIMCNSKELDCTKLGIEGFRSFLMLFLNVNAEHRHIDHNPKTGSFEVIDIIHFQKLLGINTLWSIAIQNLDQNVATEARNFLVDIHLKSQVEEKHKRSFVESFIKRVEEISEQLNQTIESEPSQYISRRLNWLTLIRTYLHRFDYMHIPLEDIKKYDEKNNIEVAVQLDPDNVTQKILVNSQQQIWQIVVQISRAFNLKISEFKIMTKKGCLGTNIYYDAVSAYVIKQLQIMRVTDQELAMENPRHIIGNDRLFLQRLLELLVKMQDEEKVTREIISLLEELPINGEMRAAFNLSIQKIPLGGVTENLPIWRELFNWKKVRQQNASAQIPPSTFHNIMLLHDCILGNHQNRRIKIKNNNNANLNSLQEQDPETEANEFLVDTAIEFSQSFLDRGGFKFVANFFTALDKNGLESSTLLNKALTMLIEIVNQFLSSRWYSSLKEIMSEQQIVFDLFSQNLIVIQNFVLAVEQQQRDIVKGSRVLKNDQHLISIALKLLQKMMFLHPKLMSVLSEFPNIEQLFQIIFLNISTEKIQQNFSQTFLEICKKLDQDLPKATLALQRAQSQPEEGATAQTISQTVGQDLPSVYFLRLFWNQQIRQALLIQKDTMIVKELFGFINKLMVETELANYLEVVLQPTQFVSELTKMIKQRPILEASSSLTEEDYVLTGIFNLLKSTLRKRIDIRASVPQKDELLVYLLHDCLFHKETNRNLVSKDTNMPPKCKSRNTRYSCLSLVKELTIENQMGLRTLVEYMRQAIYSSNVSWFWRTPRTSDWSITTNDKQEKSSTGYVGLKNIGCICYMNSILQQLFMITPFRKAMLEVEDKNSLTEPEESNVLFQIKRIFGSLMEYEKQYFNPKKFCMAFKDIDGSPIDPMVQKDVDEFFNMLIDRIENLIKGTKEEKVMKNLFYGVYANEFICKGCPHYSEREEPFMAIPLQVKNKKSVLEGLATFVEGEMLEGDNAYYCERCETKRDTLKRCSIKRLPNVLFLELKRFEFNFDTMQKYKVNDYCSFPMELDMKPYSQEYVSRQDLIKEMNDKNLTMDDLNSDQVLLMNRIVTDQYFQYKLKGIVVHSGTSDSGHYYSFIKDREESKDENSKWYEFNDTQVMHFDPKQIPEETFGGENEHWEAQLKQHQHDPAMQQIIHNQGRNKTKNAYILIYERLCFIDQEKFNEFTDDNSVVAQHQGQNSYERASNNFFNACRLPFTVNSQIQIPPSIHENILQKNQRFWLTRFIFNRQFLDQSLEIFKGYVFKIDNDYYAARSQNLQIMHQPGQNPNNDQFEILKYIITFTLTVAFRANYRTQIPFLIKIIRKSLTQNVRLALWFIQIFSNQQIIKEFFVDCTITDMARFTAGLIKTAMRTIYQYEKESLLVYTQTVEQGCVVEHILETQGNRIVSHHEQKNGQTATAENNKKSTSTGKPAQSTLLGHETASVFSQCEKVHQIQLKSENDPSLPALVTLINSFLHYQTSKHLLQNFDFSSNLHAVIAHFADLGPEARLYLLKTKTLNRLLRILLQNTITPQEVSYMNQMIPLIGVVRQHEQEGGYLTPNLLFSGDQKILQKERIKAAQNMQQPMIFVIYTISQLVRSCQFINTQRSSTDTSNKSETNREANQLYNGRIDEATGERLGHILDKDEVDLLINYISNRVWWRSVAQEFPMVRNRIADMFAYVATDNKEFSHMYIQEIFKVLAVSNFMVVKRYERPLIVLLKIPDAYQRDRITWVLNDIYETFRKNPMYWKFCDQLMELTYKLAKKCRMFAAEMSNSKNLVNMMSTFTRENPSFPYNQGRQKIFRDGVINWQHMQDKKKMVNQGRVDQITNYSKQRIDNLLKAVEEGKQYGESNQLVDPPTQLGDDSDDDYYNQKLLLGDSVDVYFDRGVTGWFQSKVVFHLEEMVKVQTTFANELKQECWVELESNKLAYRGTYTKNEKMDNFFYFQELYKLIEPTNSAQAQTGYQNQSSASSQAQSANYRR